jgi:Fe2+ transport system protein FeoA
MGDPDLMKARSAFLERLSALGYVEGKSIVIEERSSAVGRFRTWAC